MSELPDPMTTLMEVALTLVHEDQATASDGDLCVGTLSNTPAADLGNLPAQVRSPYTEMENFNIGREGLEKLILGLKPHKAAGPDQIRTRVLR